MAFGVITKGPVALAIPLIVAIPYTIWRKRARSLISIAGVILFVVIIAPWVWAVSRIFGVHRFYLKRTCSAVTMLVCSITIIGLCITVFWALIDLFLIPGMIREETEKLRQKLTLEVMSNTQSANASGSAPSISNPSAPPVAMQAAP